VDHVTPHKGDWNAFVTGVLQSLCEPCHKSAKRQIELRGYTVTSGSTAMPGGGFFLNYADTTERRRAEEAIRAARDAAETALRDLQAAQASLFMRRRWRRSANSPPADQGL